MFVNHNCSHLDSWWLVYVVRDCSWSSSCDRQSGQFVFGSGVCVHVEAGVLNGGTIRCVHPIGGGGTTLMYGSSEVIPYRWAPSEVRRT